MRIQQEIDRLGGIQPLEDHYYPLADDEITAIEQQVGGELPAEYEWLLKTYGAFLFVNSVEFVPVKRAPEYSHDKALEIPSGEDFAGSQVAIFYGKNQAKHIFTLRQKLQVFQDRMPNGFLPFADDGLGNQLCLNVQSPVPKVYWWNHELEWDEEDYLEETGEMMPLEVKYQNVYLVANSFSDFFERLAVLDEA